MTDEPLPPAAYREVTVTLNMTMYQAAVVSAALECGLLNLYVTPRYDEEKMLLAMDIREQIDQACAVVTRREAMRTGDQFQAKLTDRWLRGRSARS